MDLDFGRLLGRREAFCVMAARCSAADAATLKEIRDKKLYLEYAANWAECCSKLLHTNKNTANRLIQRLEEFGPDYFEVAQFVQISPETYRAIAPAITDGRIHHDGDAIALVPENAPRVAAAVAELRKALPAPSEPEREEPEPASDTPIDRVQQKCRDLIVEIRRAVELRTDALALRGAVSHLLNRLVELERTF